METTHLIARSNFQPPPGSPVPSFGQVASCYMSTHIWRCTLILLFTGAYDAALILIRASATIGPYRAVNIACGRNIAFFLRTLLEKRRPGEPGQERRMAPRALTPMTLIEDEELMAYVSGDLQQATENSWVWQGSETGMQLQQMQGPGATSTFAPGSHGGTSSSMGQPHMPSTLSDAEKGDWGGWERVEYFVGLLMGADRGEMGRDQSGWSHVPRAGDTRDPRYTPPTGFGTPPQQQQRQGESGPSRTADRISIANII
jgi:hypothetical protein